MLKKNIKLMNITAFCLVILVGCSGEMIKNQIVFVGIDYTTSADTFENGNTDKIKNIVIGVSENLKNSDVLEIHPIHAFTETGIMGKRTAPKLEGNLRDNKIQQQWLENDIKPFLDEVMSYKFDNYSLAGTNIYPIANKLRNRVEQGYKVSCYIFCDLNQEYDGEDFHEIFDGLKDPIEYASMKVQSLNISDALHGVDIKIFVPGTPEGSQTQENVRRNIKKFWKEFFRLCGSKVTIEDL